MIKRREAEGNKPVIFQRLRTQVQAQCCFTSRESKRIKRDGEPGTATSTFTQLLSSDPLPIQTVSFFEKVVICRVYLSPLDHFAVF